MDTGTRSSIKEEVIHAGFAANAYFVIIMIVGAWARKKSILTPENEGQITQLVLTITYPAIILSGVTGNGPRIEGMELAYAFGVIVIMLIVLMGSAF